MLNAGPHFDRRTVDPLALRIFTAVRDRSVQDRTLVYRAALRRGDMPRPEWEADAAESFAACWADLGHVPSRHGYASWLSRSENSGRTPTSRLLRLCGGRWSEVRRVYAAEPRSSVNHALMVTLGPRRSAASLAQALRRWREQEPHVEPTFRNWRVWALRELGSATTAVRDVALAPQTFLVAFGGWGHALAFVGALAEWARNPDWVVELHGRKAVYSHEAIAAAIREVWIAAGEPPACEFTRVRFKTERRKLITDAALENEVKVIPSPWLIETRLGCWKDALRLAGLPGAETLRSRRGAVCRLSREEIREVIRRTVEELGSEITSPTAWDHLRRERLADHERGFPSSWTITGHFGGRDFADSIRRALAGLDIASPPTEEGEQ